jgi:hypothetical protein
MASGGRLTLSLLDYAYTQATVGEDHVFHEPTHLWATPKVIKFIQDLIEPLVLRPGITNPYDYYHFRKALLNSIEERPTLQDDELILTHPEGTNIPPGDCVRLSGFIIADGQQG